MGDPQALAGKILGLLFFNPSLRTLASMQAAMAKLGGTSFVVTPGGSSWKLETRTGVVMDGEASEHVREAIPVLAGYADVLGVRAFASGTDLAADLADTSFRQLAALSPKPVVNLESAIDHPCQALADWKTLDDLGVARHGKLVLSWANHPKALPLAVPAAVLRMAALRGMEVTVLSPEAYALPEPLLAEARALAAGSGGSVVETDDRSGGARGRRDRLRQVVGLRGALRRRRDGERRCAPGSPHGASRRAGSRAPARRASCTACRCGGTSSSPTRCSTRRAASSYSRRTTGSGRRWRSCTGCSPE